MADKDFEERVAFYKENFTLEELAKILTLRDMGDKTTMNHIDQWFPNGSTPFEIMYNEANEAIKQAVMDEFEGSYYDAEYNITLPDGVKFDWTNTSFD